MPRDTVNVGDVVDERYRITGLLGAGGMGSVYRAEHVTIRRPVALKLLHREMASDPEFSQRFEREAFLTGRTDHPNCVTVSDFGQLDNGSFYLVMELIDGTLLSDLIDSEGQIAVDRALRIARHVLRGLGHAHKANIVHRDVKPANVIVVEEADDADFAKILDFGIAKLVGDSPSEIGDNKLTRVGTTVGTPTYIAPEQALGGDIDARADLYSMAVMLYEMIAGRPPFVAEDRVKVLAMHLSNPVPPLSEIAPHVQVPAAIEALLQRGMAKDRVDRFADADDFIAAIDEVLDQLCESGAGIEANSTSSSSPASPRSATQHGRAARPWWRRRWVAVASAAAALLVVLAVALDDSSGGKAGPGPAVASPQLILSGRPPEPSEIAQKAADLLARDRTSKAIALLEKASIETDPNAQLQLGHAYANARRDTEALAAYRRAVDLSGALSANATLRANARLMLDRRNPKTIAAAAEFLVHELDDDDARQRLIQIASSHKRLAIRQKAREVADELGLGSKIDRLTSYSLDLQQGRSCEDRRKAVARLRSLGDKRAIPELERAKSRRSGGFLGLGKRSVNRCLRQEADDAIAYLEDLPD